MPTSPQDDPAPSHILGDKQATEHLANERTFLAWVRTSIAVLSLGFVVAKFGLWLERIADVLPDRTGSQTHSPAGWSMPIGVGMMAVGASLTLLAAWHYSRVSKQIEAGHVEPAKPLVILVSAVVVFLAALLTVYLLLSVR